VSVEEFDVVDVISTDKETGRVILTISDHSDWSDSTQHQIRYRRTSAALWTFLLAALPTLVARSAMSAVFRGDRIAYPGLKM